MEKICDIILLSRFIMGEILCDCDECALYVTIKYLIIHFSIIGSIFLLKKITEIICDTIIEINMMKIINKNETNGFQKVLIDCFKKNKNDKETGNQEEQ